MKHTITLGNGEHAAEIELYYNVKAMQDIAERCGGNIEKLGDWMQGENATETVTRFACLIADLANGAVYKHNSEIALGLATGETNRFFSDGDIMALLQPKKISEYKDAIFATINGNSKFAVPENVRLEEQDEDLAEIEEATEKNESGAAGKTVCA